MDYKLVLEFTQVPWINEAWPRPTMRGQMLWQNILSHWMLWHWVFCPDTLIFMFIKPDQMYLDLIWFRTLEIVLAVTITISISCVPQPLSSTQNNQKAFSAQSRNLYFLFLKKCNLKIPYRFHWDECFLFSDDWCKRICSFATNNTIKIFKGYDAWVYNIHVLHVSKFEQHLTVCCHKCRNSWDVFVRNGMLDRTFRRVVQIKQLKVWSLLLVRALS